MEPLKFFNEYVGDLMCAEFRLPLQAGSRSYVFNHAKSQTKFIAKWLSRQQALEKMMDGLRLEVGQQRLIARQIEMAGRMFEVAERLMNDEGKVAGRPVNDEGLMMNEGVEGEVAGRLMNDEGLMVNDEMEEDGGVEDDEVVNGEGMEEGVEVMEGDKGEEEEGEGEEEGENVDKKMDKKGDKRMDKKRIEDVVWHNNLQLLRGGQAVSAEELTDADRNLLLGYLRLQYQAWRVLVELYHSWCEEQVGYYRWTGDLIDFQGLFHALWVTKRFEPLGGVKTTKAYLQRMHVFFNLPFPEDPTHRLSEIANRKDPADFLDELCRDYRDFWDGSWHK